MPSGLQRPLAATRRRWSTSGSRRVRARLRARRLGDSSNGTRSCLTPVRRCASIDSLFRGDWVGLTCLLVVLLQRIRTRLERPPTPPKPPAAALPIDPSDQPTSSLGLPEIETPEDDFEGESSFSASVPSTASGAYADADDGQWLHAPAGVAPTLTNRSAYTGSMPPSPTLSARTLSPAPVSSRAYGMATSLVGRLRRSATPVSFGLPAALLLFALFVLRQARARRIGWRALLRQWIVNAVSEVAMEVVGLYRLGTALSYV